ncbi:peroxiredoxin [Tenggerimyces flavus]|uniref:thioredoxin-dependent peroxiredoxin n=1 Tax=Tenggerimyces flavus TaxID=1708749 RepID=A0ABV7YD18_9ACTN|nr:peroxiredoxin [Tenggerimyces flavus]MBM7788929.1 peroxiredoxin [Tenggerimyces flavus]
MPGLAVGSTAPDFTLRDQHGGEVSLASLLDERPVVVVFYPFAFTGVCTRELHALRDSLPSLSAAASLVAVSCDSMFALRVFGDAEGLRFPLLSDFWPHGAVARAFGVFDAERGCALRGTFVLDRAGVVRWQVVNALADARSISELLAALGSVEG